MYLNRIITYLFLFLIGIGGFFGNVNINIQNQDNQINAIVSYETNISYASTTAEPAKKDDASKKTVDAYNSMITTLNIVIYTLSAIITPIVLFVGWLLSPDWTSGDLFNLRESMYKLWITVSNIVYFIYAILLIFIALGTMFNQERFSYKIMLPKLALGILMVPFTWWFVQWTISIASVVTTSVMTIPHETLAQSDSKWFSEKSIPMSVSVDNTGTGSKTSPSKCPEACISPKQFLEKGGGVFGPMIVYGYSIFRFQEIKTLSTGVDIASAALNIVHSSVVGAIMFLVFGLLTLALAAILFVRAIKLWMYAIFSPLFTFRFVAGSNLLGGEDDSFSIKEFIGLAFVPAIVGLTLSFGLIIVSAVHGPGGPKGGTSSSTQTCNLEGEGCLLANIMGSPDNKILRKIKTDDDSGKKYTLTMLTYGDITFSFLGKTVNQTKEETTGIGAIDAVGGMFGTLIIDIIALVFIWMAFMAAKNVSKAVKGAVEPFEAIGKSVGNMAKSLPKYTPLPIPGGSLAGMDKVARMPEQFMSQKASEKTKGIEEKMGNLFGVNLAYGIAEQNKMKQYLDHRIGNTELSNIKQLSSGVKDKGIDSNTVAGQAFINDNAAALKKALTDGARLDIPGYYTTDQIKAAAEGSDSDKKKLVASWLANKHISGEGDAIKFLKEKGGAMGTPNTGTTGITGKFTDNTQKNYNIEVGTETIKFDFTTKKMSITDEDRVELKKFTKKEFEKALDKNLSDAQKNEIMKSLEKEVFATEIKP